MKRPKANPNHAIILENGFEIDIPKDIIAYLAERNITWEWYDLRKTFWPENRQKTFKFFSSLHKEQLFVCHAEFTNFEQLECMINLLYNLIDRHFIIKIDNGLLPKKFMKFYENENSSILPLFYEGLLEKAKNDNDVEYAFRKMYAFKERMNKKFLSVLEAHEVYWINYKDIRLKTLEDIKQNL